MICKKCNFENDNAACFCENCGANLVVENNFPLQAYYPKASLGKRLLARVIDSLVMIPAYVCLGFGIGLLGLLLSLPATVYFFIKDGLGDGQSWGKKAMGLMVVYLPDNAPCTKGQSSVRFLVEMFLSVTFIGWLVEPIMAFVENHGRRLADLAAKTQVIEKEKWQN